MGTAAVAMPTRVDLATWDAEVCQRDDAYELVEGVPTMAPGESTFNRTVGSLLTGLLNAQRRDWVAATDVSVTISEVPATVRCPDVSVFPRASVRSGARAGALGMRLLAVEVLFVAEVVSPGSVERDLVAKRRDYARTGIPAYLVVDLRDGRRELTLYAERGPDGLFLDVEPADRVTALVAGTPIEIAVDAILP